MAKKLKNLSLRQIALVDRGANQGAKIILAKRADDATEEEEEGPPCPDCGGDHTQAEHDDAMEAKKMADDLKTQLEKAQAEAKAAKDELIALKGAGALTTDAESLRKQYEATRVELEKGREALSKELETAKAEKEAAHQEVVKIRTERRRERFIKRAAELQHLPGAPVDDFGEILDKIEGSNALTAAQFTKLNGLLDSWNTLLEKSAVFTEMGRAGGGEEEIFVGAAGRLDILAKDRAAKDKVPYAKAYAEVLLENPKLYKKYLAEQGGR